MRPDTVITMITMTKLLINGSKGRMGQMLVACAARNPSLEVVAQADLGDDLASMLDRCDVVIDFSFHDGTKI